MRESGGSNRSCVVYRQPLQAAEHATVCNTLVCSTLLCSTLVCLLATRLVHPTSGVAAWRRGSMAAWSRSGMMGAMGLMGGGVVGWQPYT